MKIIQVNTWCGRISGSLLRLIAQEKPDIICVQEVYDTGGKTLKVFADQFNILYDIGNISGCTNIYFSPTWDFELGGNSVAFGNAILSRYPISNQKEEFTSGERHTKTPDNDGIPNTRKWQSCVIQVQDKTPITIFNYQGYLANKDRGDEKTVQTLSSLKAAIEQAQGPVIVCGDFNLSPDTEGITFIDEAGLKNLTTDYKVKTTLSEAHYAPMPDRGRVACDYILTSEEIKINNFSVSEEIVSDHKALILDFDF